MRVLVHAAIVLAGCKSPAPRESPGESRPSGAPVASDAAPPKIGALELERQEHRFWRGLAEDIQVHFDYPKVLETKQLATACLQLAANGAVAHAKLDPPSGDDELDKSAQRALAKVTRDRGAKPVEIPADLVAQATKGWACVRLGNLARSP